MAKIIYVDFKSEITRFSSRIILVHNVSLTLPCQQQYHKYDSVVSLTVLHGYNDFAVSLTALNGYNDSTVSLTALHSYNDSAVSLTVLHGYNDSAVSLKALNGYNDSAESCAHARVQFS